MSCVEEGLVFPCRGDFLLGVLSMPASGGASDGSATSPTMAGIGVVFIVGGPQYRAGSHRQFTLLARAIAVAGYPVLRFDYRGMGDSTGVPRSFEAVDDDIAAAIDALQQKLPHIRRIVLWGLCDGASAALLYLHASSDSRVAALCLVNPWVRSEQSLAVTRVRNYYGRRLASPAFWRGFASGRVSMASLRDFFRALALNLNARRKQGHGNAPQPSSFVERMSAAASRFEGRLLILVSERDMTGAEFAVHGAADPGWKEVLARPTTSCLRDADADHTFSNPGGQRSLDRYTVGWLRSHAPTSSL